jgi:transketolase
MFKQGNCECKELSITGYQFEGNEDCAQRFEAYDWQMPSLEDGKRFGR